MVFQNKILTLFAVDIFGFVVFSRLSHGRFVSRKWQQSCKMNSLVRAPCNIDDIHDIAAARQWCFLGDFYVLTTKTCYSGCYDGSGKTLHTLSVHLFKHYGFDHVISHTISRNVFFPAQKWTGTSSWHENKNSKYHITAPSFVTHVQNFHRAWLYKYYHNITRKVTLI